MNRKLISFCEVFSKGKLFDLSLYDDNGNTCYSGGTLHMTPDDVIAIKNLLDVSDNGPYTYHLNGTNYLCVKTDTNVVYCKGGFNQQAVFDSNEGEPADVTDVTVNVNTAVRDEVNRNTLNVVDDSKGDTDEGNNTEIINADRSLKADMPTAHENKGYSEDGETACLSKEEDGVQANIKRNSNGAPLDTSKRGHNRRTPNDPTPFLAAMKVKGYIVLIHGIHGGRESWLSCMAKLNNKIMRYLP